MKKYKLELNEIQAKMMSRILKEEIMQQRQWKEEEKDHKNVRDYLSANMWDLIEQLCSQNVEEYWLPSCMQRTDEEEDELERLYKYENTNN